MGGQAWFACIPGFTYRHGGEPIKDWKDLFQPALKGRLGFVEAPREFMGAVLKSLGLPFNATVADLAACHISEDVLRARLQRLRQQVRTTGALPKSSGYFELH